MKNEDTVRRYTTICKEEFRKHNTVQRIVDVRKVIESGTTETVMDELNEIDNLRTNIVLIAERKCRKLKTGKLPYAPDNVQKYGRQIWLWSLIIAKKAHQKVSTRLIKRLEKKLNIDDGMKLTAEAIKKLCATA